MYTNMILLKRVTAKALIESGLSELVVSMSGFDEAMYKRVYRSDHYRDVLENVKAFGELNRQTGNPVRFRVDMRVDRPIKEVYESDDLKEVAKIIGLKNIGVKFAYDSWCGKIKEGDLLGNMRLRSARDFRKPRISPCTELYSGLMVYWDGRVGACGCRDVDARELIIGDANTESLMSIWHGDKLQTLRDEFLTDKVKDICSTCSHYNNLSAFLQKPSNV